MMHTGTYVAHLVNILCGQAFMAAITQPGVFAGPQASLGQAGTRA